MLISSRRFSRLIAAAAALALVALGAHPAAASNDPLFDKQWSLVQANVPAGWATTTGGGVRIGIVDTGVNRNHDDLKDRVVEAATCLDTGGNQAACTTGSGAGNDLDGHGTHVSGIAAATMGNNTGVAGVAPSAQLVVARVFKDNRPSDPSASLNDVKAGIDWVVAHGAKVVNLSLGFSGGVVGGAVGGGGNDDSPLRAAVQAAWDHGAIPVLAAGNENASLLGGDGSYGDLDAIVVGATIRNGSVADYSNGLTKGTKWGIVAPGGDGQLFGPKADRILSTFAGDDCQPASGPSCYYYLSGTSMAAPMVSGAAALMLSRGLSRQQAVQTLLDTADKVSCGEGCQGRLNVGRAVAKKASVNNTGTGGRNSSSSGGRATTPGSPTTTRRRSAATSSASASETTVPSTAEATIPPDAPLLETPTTRKPREAIVLNTDNSDDGGIPAATGAAGVGLLAGALVVAGIRIRRARSTVSF